MLNQYWYQCWHYINPTSVQHLVLNGIYTCITLFISAPLVKGRNSHCTGLNQPAVIEEKLAKVDYPLIGK